MFIDVDYNPILHCNISNYTIGLKVCGHLIFYFINPFPNKFGKQPVAFPMKKMCCFRLAKKKNIPDVSTSKIRHSHGDIYYSSLMVA